MKDEIIDLLGEGLETLFGHEDVLRPFGGPVP